MRLFLTLVVCFFITNINSQNENIRCIRFHHHNSIIVGSTIDVFVYQDDSYDNLFFIDVKTSKSRNKLSISREEFLKLNEAVSKISPNDVLKGDRICLDSSRTEIEFSKNIISFNAVKYSVNCLNISDNETAWKDYLNAVNLILDLAKLKFSDLK